MKKKSKKRGLKITPTAVALFRDMEVLKEQCTCSDDREPWDDKCPTCEQVKELDSELAAELDLKPWECPPSYERPGEWADEDADGVARWRALKRESEKCGPSTR
jgi:hypothetical protein